MHSVYSKRASRHEYNGIWRHMQIRGGGQGKDRPDSHGVDLRVVQARVIAGHSKLEEDDRQWHKRKVKRNADLRVEPFPGYRKINGK